MVIARRHQHWIIALLMMVFLGQSLAVVAMPCQLMEKSPASDDDMVTMEHSMMGMHHDMSQMMPLDASHDVPHPHDCCKNMGHCSSNSCSLAALSYSLSVSALFTTSLMADSYSHHIPNTPIFSLYRPPIFR